MYSTSLGLSFLEIPTKTHNPFPMELTISLLTIKGRKKHILNMLWSDITILNVPSDSAFSKKSLKIGSLFPCHFKIFWTFKNFFFLHLIEVKTFNKICFWKQYISHDQYVFKMEHAKKMPIGLYSCLQDITLVN